MAAVDPEPAASVTPWAMPTSGSFDPPVVISSDEKARVIWFHPDDPFALSWLIGNVDQYGPAPYVLTAIHPDAASSFPANPPPTPRTARSTVPQAVRRAYYYALADFYEWRAKTTGD